VLSNRAIGWAAIVLILVGIGLAAGLLIAFGNGQHPDQLDAIKTAGTIVIGTGGAAALWLTARRQQTTEIALNQKQFDQAAVDRAFAFQQQQAVETRSHLERVATATEADAVARRITDLYTKAADQLGSDKAPVRLAGLYALERLAQDNPTQRPTIVAVLCAYLRMPFTLPPATSRTSKKLSEVSDTDQARFAQRTQEQHVRLTAQTILADHLRHGSSPDHPNDTFWPGTSLNLTGAHLVDFDLIQCSIANAQFDNAQFSGNAAFGFAQFSGYASFGGRSSTATLDSVVPSSNTTRSSTGRSSMAAPDSATPISATTLGS
jgi:hypothetical protein